MTLMGEQGKKRYPTRWLPIFITLLIPTLSISAIQPPPLSAGKHNKSSSIYTKVLSSEQSTHDNVNPHRRISLNFNNIETRQLLQVIAQFTNLNFVVSDNVKGHMSIHLKNIPWRQALHVILKSQALGQRRIGDVVLVAPLSEFAKDDIQQLKIKQKVAELAPLRNRIIRLKYAKAEDIQKLLTASGPLLTARGQISIDKRTNSIWLRDTPKQLAQVTPLIRQLDYPVKQVLIEARIVSIQRPFERELGVRIGVSKPNHLSGTLEGANQIAQGTQPVNVTPIAQRLNFNVPATAIFGANPGTIGLAVTKLGGDAVLDLELSALEQEGRIELVSSPRLITSNLHAAHIQTGEEIPYQESTSSGATSIAFKNATLSLTVTPQITPDHRIIMELLITNNSAGASVKFANGAEAIPINTEEEESRVILNNHQTVVLGGIYTQDKRKIISRIPFLGKIPILGRLFRHELTRNNQTDLLIFLTPHIIQKPSDLK